MTKRTIDVEVPAGHYLRVIRVKKEDPLPVPTVDTYTFPEIPDIGSRKVLDELRYFRQLPLEKQKEIIREALFIWQSNRRALKAIDDYLTEVGFLDSKLIDAFNGMDASVRKFMAEYTLQFHGVRISPEDKVVDSFKEGNIVVPTGNPNAHEYELNVPYLYKDSGDVFFKWGSKDEGGNHMTRKIKYLRTPSIEEVIALLVSRMSK